MYRHFGATCQPHLQESSSPSKTSHQYTYLYTQKLIFSVVCDSVVIGRPPLNCNAQKYRSTLSLTSALDGSENCSLWGYYAASSGNYLPTFRDTLSVPSSRVEYPKRKPGNLFYIGVYIGIYKGFLFGYSTLEEGTGRMSQNVGNKLLLLAA